MLYEAPRYAPAVRPTLHRLHLDAAAAVVVAITVLMFAFGSSSVPALHDGGTRGRWVALGVLLVVAALSALAREGVPRFWPLPVAIAAFLGVLAILSTLWSVQPRLSFERGVSFGVLLLAAGLLAYASAGVPARRALLLRGIVGGAVLVAVAGLLVLAFKSSYAVLWWSPGGPATRFRGLGENPNTVPLLFSLAAPAAAWLVVQAESRRERVLWAVAFLLLYGELAATQSRGALVAMAAGLALVAVLVPAARRRRAQHVVGAVALIAIAVVITSLRFSVGQGYEATHIPPQQVPDAVATTSTSLKHCTSCDLLTFPGRADDLGNPFFTGKFAISNSAVSSSGRLSAWKGALHTAAERPFAGFGFGTEDRVFVDRYYFFVGSRPENGFLGFFLQLGVLGLLGFAGLGLMLLVGLVRVLLRGEPDERSVSVGFAGVVLAGFVAALTQSYPYSVGNIAALTLWIAVLGLATASTAREMGSRHG